MNLGDPKPVDLGSKEKHKEKLAEYLELIFEIKELFYIDDIPLTRITVERFTEYEHFKCRKSYHTTVRNLASRLTTDNEIVVDPEIIQSCRNYIIFVQEELSKRNEIDMITREDINRTDSFLERLEESLKKEILKT